MDEWMKNNKMLRQNEATHCNRFLRCNVAESVRGFWTLQPETLLAQPKLHLE
jgi:hypothetical protein